MAERTKTIRRLGLDPRGDLHLLYTQRKRQIELLEDKHGFERCEEIARRDPPALKILVEHLWKQNKKNEAYSVYLRNQFKIHNKALVRRFSEEKSIELGLKYLVSSIAVQDDFQPQSSITSPRSIHFFAKLIDYGVLRKNVRFVDEDNMSEFKDCFLDEQIVGVDCKMCASDLTQFCEPRLSILQLASRRECAVFDLKSLRNNLLFLDLLVRLMESKDIRKIGFKSFNWMGQLRALVKYGFQTEHLVDIEKTVPKSQSMDLDSLVQKHLNKELCRSNQVSGWFQRPLREAQLHQATLDAFILLPLYRKIVDGRDFNDESAEGDLEDLDATKRNGENTSAKSSETEIDCEGILRHVCID